MHKLLFIDDERTSSHLLKLSLEFEGFQVTNCPNLTQARATIAKTPGFDAVVSDYHLPKGEVGTTLIAEIRAGETDLPNDIPIVMTSGDDRSEEVAKEAGASTFLAKPFTPTELADVLKSLIESH